jgi:hypothetical protein
MRIRDQSRSPAAFKATYILVASGRVGTMTTSLAAGLIDKAWWLAEPQPKAPSAQLQTAFIWRSRGAGHH